MTALASASPADRHRIVAEGFAAEIVATTDWAAAAPVDGWAARDVVRHLVEWFPAFLEAGGVSLPAVASVDDDPVAAWSARSKAVQEILESGDAAGDFTHPRLGTMPLERAVDQFYSADVFMHTWDLAQAGGRRPAMDSEFAAALLAGMAPIEEMLRGSGQYGPAFPTPDESDPVVSLAAFIGRDPSFVA
ncbi:TIGR03086 family protein [Gordonia sp. PDNC005]|uniref:TIGR03086 family protein n=1 Tax=unclassified Gordonia (in: high G+C Gram-positive bacteria) TaxID=2657482 RepID=UPI0019669CF2|nr:TIGR03086 family protein [Gordonia sp. PDNC005]QRY63126.1 TIGR03086 family protein [Gordonia sp. PDNC005]